MRIYLSRKIGSGSNDDPYRPAISDLQLSGWSCIDNDIWMLVKTDNTQEEHELLLSSDNVIYCPIESKTGGQLDLNYPVSYISSENFETITNQVVQILGVTNININPDMSIGNALRIVIDRLL